MSKVSESWGEAVSPAKQLAAVPEAFREAFPELTAVLLGSFDASGKCTFSASTVSLFWDTGRLKYCIQPKSGTKVAFGSCERPERGLEAVEASLAAGWFEWRESKGRNRA